MQTFKSILQIIYYCIWIPLGILLFILAIYLMVNNPLKALGGFGAGGPGGGGPGSFGSPGGGFGEGASGGGMPSKEMIEQYMKQGGQSGPKLEK